MFGVIDTFFTYSTNYTTNGKCDEVIGGCGYIRDGVEEEEEWRARRFDLGENGGDGIDSVSWELDLQDINPFFMSCLPIHPLSGMTRMFLRGRDRT